MNPYRPPCYNAVEEPSGLMDAAILFFLTVLCPITVAYLFVRHFDGPKDVSTLEERFVTLLTHIQFNGFLVAVGMFVWFIFFN